MKKLIKGLHKFHHTYFTKQRRLFERLASGQHPETLFITCSDSRIDPNLLTQTKPGEIFTLRNAGNIVPPYGAVGGGEDATIEYAVAVLGVRHIIVCGHSHCGAMKAVLHPETLDALPTVAAWLTHLDSARAHVLETNHGLTDEDLLARLTEQNALTQLEHLRTHPTVAAKLVAGELQLHAWDYQIGIGSVSAYNADAGKFISVIDTERAPRPRRSRRSQTPQAIAQTTWV
ncbi:MAG: carbonic anhydrase [Pyrinomonadaceae bacterium]